MRRPIPLRVKIAVAGLAGVGLAWLIPKGGGAPEPGPTPTASDQPGVTAVQIPLDDLHEGVGIPAGLTYRVVDGVRIFLVRDDRDVIGLLARSTAPGGAAVYFCPKNGVFEADDGTLYSILDGAPARWSTPVSLERVRVIVSGEVVTVFPHDVQPGTSSVPPTPTPSPEFRLPAPCTPAERVG